MKRVLLNTCCFIGHREITETAELREQIYAAIEKLILENQVDTFLFGSKSRFDSLCHEQTTRLKEKYPYIKRIYVRAEFPEINDSYKNYLLKNYEETYYPDQLLGAGRAVYVKRNREMIDNSHFCVVYFHKECLPKNRKSGTESALCYAVKKKRNIVLFP